MHSVLQCLSHTKWTYCFLCGGCQKLGHDPFFSGIPGDVVMMEKKRDRGRIRGEEMLSVKQKDTQPIEGIVQRRFRNILLTYIGGDVAAVTSEGDNRIRFLSAISARIKLPLCPIIIIKYSCRFLYYPYILTVSGLFLCWFPRLLCPAGAFAGMPYKLTPYG